MSHLPKRYGIKYGFGYWYQIAANVFATFSEIRKVMTWHALWLVYV